MGSNIQAQGVANLLSDIVRFFPSPDCRECAGINRKTNEIYEADYDFAKAKSAYVFKTMVDPFIGKYIASSGILNNIYITYQLLILTNRLEMRSNYLSIFIIQVLHYLSETCIIHIHLCNIYHSRKGCGKTSLAEAMAYVSGATSRIVYPLPGSLS